MKTIDDLNLTHDIEPVDCGYSVCIYHNGQLIDSAFVSAALDVDKVAEAIKQEWADAYNNM